MRLGSKDRYHRKRGRKREREMACWRGERKWQVWL